MHRETVIALACLVVGIAIGFVLGKEPWRERGNVSNPTGWSSGGPPTGGSGGGQPNTGSGGAPSGSTGNTNPAADSKK